MKSRYSEYMCTQEKQKMPTMTLRLDDETNNRLSILAGTTDRSKAYLTTQALKLFLENNEWQVSAINDAILEADMASPDQFVENDKVMAWMETWGTASEVEPPL
jgi:RHH-type rel operon transcriptional repressor/antitoxin RelB